MSTYPGQSIMVTSGCFVYRTVRNVKTHEPNRFEHESCVDETGTISLSGKSVGVQTGYWGNALVWQPVGSGPAHPHCGTCSTPLDIGVEMEWRCWTCREEARKQRAHEKMLQEA